MSSHGTGLDDLRKSKGLHSVSAYGHGAVYILGDSAKLVSEFQARSKDQEILEEGGAAGPSLLPRKDHE